MNSIVQELITDIERPSLVQADSPCYNANCTTYDDCIGCPFEIVS